ncbi:putative checkpoint protein kinase (SldA) [Aspergillus saccharolyticus JOP 1030-1]|uniref:Putative checkpoint protein kinase n=1 Tax=Aspergillus saccharolyticus JOP 1030-1 TaxID=1450539 RepID=A0A318ZFK9_9EURO|nr:putative checkpoint protein kinase [Aspergillus saccharolyticus JOP 1030-1]PYH45114.1 putative checkpoint protein kinase [Aspergillus saccharolyticus JOP 1030-1]
MAASDDLIDFDIIENQKENIQSLPGGRSARELARIFSPRETTDKLAVPSPNEMKSVNDAVRQEYEAELQAIDESDDPLDIYDRYVKWTLNAYPSAQATPESGLLPLLERAVKHFLSSAHYKNDPRYLRLWLQYIRLFSDSPRETFAFLARHHIGEGLALFYEEFAAWLEGAGRWTQADEVYHLGLDREARPAERLARKYREFQHRYEQRTQDNGPSSPALPAVRPALAAKVNPFASATPASPDPQAERAAPARSAAPKTKSGKPKMAIFSDADAASQPAVSGPAQGWDSIGSMQDRRKENRVEAKPWAGETLKAGKKPVPKEKMTIFRDESQSKIQVKQDLPDIVPEHRVKEAINPRTGRRERVFVNLDAVYPDYKNPNHEVSFEELRALHRGWLEKDWRVAKQPLREIPGNSNAEMPMENPLQHGIENELPAQFKQKLTVRDSDNHPQEQAEARAAQENKTKARKMKMREVKQETQTIKMKFDSPTGSKIRRKSTAEPTMTIHTRAATDEIYSIFNQPLKAETDHAAESDFDDDDYTSAGESTVTGHISAASSDFGDDETTTFHKSFDEDGFEDNTRAESVIDGEWTQFSACDVPESHTSRSLAEEHPPYNDAENEEPFDENSDLQQPERQRFVPEMPEDYVAPYGTYRDPAMVAQNRLPFMTPIVEQTEYSISMTAARAQMYNAKTPSRPQMGNLLSSPLLGTTTPYHDDHFADIPEDVTICPNVDQVRSSMGLTPLSESSRHEPVIEQLQCSPTDKDIRNTILRSLQPPLASYSGYHNRPQRVTHYGTEVQRFFKANSKRGKSGDEAAFDLPILDLPGAERSYIIRRELGAGAYAPVYFAESIESLPSDSENESTGNSSGNSNGTTISSYSTPRYGFEAIKLEVGPPNEWEFYMIRTAHDRLTRNTELSRATDSIIRAHELHVYKGESILVEDYRGQGTILDLVNLVRNEPISTSTNSEGGLDEVLAMFFTVELFRTIEALHACGILHGDIKADNCLVRLDDKPVPPPSLIDFDNDYLDPREVHYSPRGYHGWCNKGLSLIDFGRGIDMHAFSPSVQFIADWDVKKHECNEIRESRPWTHQIDLYGLAGTIHVMLFGKYIESMPVRSSEGASSPSSEPPSLALSASSRTYRIRESLKRYWEREIWSDVFDLLLNPGAERWVRVERESGNPAAASLSDPETPGPVLPVTSSMRLVRERMEDWLLVNAEKKGLGLQIRKLEAIFAERKKRLEKV